MTIGPYEVPGYHVGDCRALLAEVPDESIHCCVTSPPYWGLRDYGVDGQLGLEETPEAYVAAMASVFSEVRRVLRKDGTCWVNLGDSYAGQPCGVQGKNGANATRTAGKLGVRERLQHKGGESIKPKDLVGIPWRVAFALQASGWYLRSDIIWSKPNPMPESVTDRPTKAHEYLFLLAKSESYHYDGDAIKEPVSKDYSSCSDYGGFTKKARLKTGVAGDGESHAPSAIDSKWEPDQGRNRRSVWHVPTEPTPDAHFATFPRKLVDPCILAGCPPGGVVLDPFGGSGTVGRVAEDLGRHWLLFDLNPAYGEIAKRKTAQMGLLIRAVTP
jgi:DNA modification methylase